MEQIMTMKSIETSFQKKKHRNKQESQSDRSTQKQNVILFFRSFFSETHTVSFQFSLFTKKMLFAKGCSNFLIGAALLLSFRCLWRMVYSTPKLTNVASNLSGHEGRLWASGAGRRCGAATVAGRRRPTPAAEGLKVGDGDHQARCTCRTTSSHATFSFSLSLSANLAANLRLCSLHL